MLVGYMRVSSDSDRQTTDLQRDALLSAGVDSRHLTNLAAGDTSVGSTPRTGTSTPNDPSATPSRSSAISPDTPTESPSATAASPASTQTTSRSGIANPPGTDTENLPTPSPPSPPRSSSAASCSTPYRADCIASATSASSPTAAGHKPSTSLVEPSVSPNKTTTQKRAILRAQPRTKALTTTPAISSRLVPVPTVAGCFATCGKSPYSASASHRATHPVPSRRNPIRDDTSLWIPTSRRRHCADSPKHPKTAPAGLLKRTAMSVISHP